MTKDLRKGPRPLKKRRWWLWVVGGLVLLLLLNLSALGVKLYAESRVLDALEQKLKRYGWTLDGAEVQLSLNGEVEVRRLRASGPEGGRVEVEEIRAQVPLMDALHGVRPERFEIRGVDGFLSRADVEALRSRPREGGDGEGGGLGLTLDVKKVSLSLDTQTSLGVIGLDLEEVLIGRDEEGWGIEGEGHLVMDEETPFAFSLERVSKTSWSHLKLAFLEPMQVEVPEVGLVAVGGVDLAGTAASLSGALFDLRVVPRRGLGVEEVRVSRIDLSLAREQDWIVRSVSLFEPRLVVELHALLDGPVGARFPVLRVLADAISERYAGESFGGRRPTQAAGTPEPKEEESGADGPSRWKEMAKELPGVSIEGGGVELRIGAEHLVSLSGLSFDTERVGGGEDHYSLSLELQGARASLDVELPEQGLPRGTLEVKGMKVSDLFALTEVPPPPELEGELDFSVTLRKDEEGAYLVGGEVEVREVGFFHQKISEYRVRGVNASLRGEVRYDHAGDSLSFEDVVARSGPVELGIGLDITALRADPFVEFSVTGDLRCGDIPAAIPEGVLGSITGLEVAGGRMKPEVRGSLYWRRPLTFKMKAEGIPGECEILSVAPHDVMALNSEDYTHTYTEYSTLPGGVSVGPGSDAWVDYADLPAYVPAAMYLTEDKRFFDHGGVRVPLINRAVRLNLRDRRYVYGGSTISQQLVKNLFLTRRKNLARKVEEILIVWRMETVVSKERILELYVNCIEFGPDVYGVEQGAGFYFEKDAASLTPLEAGYLASLKVAPYRGGKFYLRRKFHGPGRWWNKRQRYIQVVLAENGYISPLQAIAARPWVPEFVYPDPEDEDDFRNQWLRQRDGL